MLTLGDVITQTGIGLELVTGGERALTRRVVGAHSMEVAQPSRWLEPDWIMLTIGMRLRDASQQEHRRLVADVAEGGLAALGFGIGMVFDDVPPGMLDEAKKRGLPIFIVPVHSQFRTIVDFVHHSLDSEQTSVLHRALSLQRYLMDALSSQQPRDDLLTRLSTTLQCDAAVIRYDGRVVLARGSIDFDRVWAEVTARDPREQAFDLDGTQVLSFPLIIDGHPLEWLVVTVRRLVANPLVVREVSRSAARLLESISQARRVAVHEERAVGARLLDRLIAQEVTAADVDRLRAFGFNVANGARVAIVGETASPADRQPQRVAELIERRMIMDHTPHLVQARAEDVVTLLGTDDDADTAAVPAVEALMAELASAGIAARAGAGRLIHRAEEIAKSARDATLGLARLERLGATAGTVASDDNFGLAEWLVHSATASEVEERATLVLQKLNQHPDLYETLRVYLRENMTVKAAAHALGLHPNSLRYRLARIEQVLDRRLEESSTIVELSLAMLVDRSASSSGRR